MNIYEDLMNSQEERILGKPILKLVQSLYVYPCIDQRQADRRNVC